jgi:hypothetical protein
MLSIPDAIPNLYWVLTLIQVAIKKIVDGQLKVIYDLHIVQWQSGFLGSDVCV